jgi:hypothetical protein
MAIDVLGEPRRLLGRIAGIGRIQAAKIVKIITFLGSDVAYGTATAGWHVTYRRRLPQNDPSFSTAGMRE